MTSAPATASDAFRDVTVLVVDDTPVSVLLLERLLTSWGVENVVSTSNSREALGLVEVLKPDLLLLDLHMPPPDGMEVLRRVRAADDGAAVPLPVIVLTADETLDARREALGEGATDYLTKPFDATEAKLRIGGVLNTRRLQRELQRHNAVLEQRVRARTKELEAARLEVLEHLAIASEYRDDSTHEHARRVGRTAGALLRALGVDDAQAELTEQAAPLHDIGKIGISDALLLKAGPLTPDERTLMQTHTTLGSHILKSSSAAMLQLARTIALSHHEHWDGRGYPSGIAGEEIPLAGRVTAVADVFDALTHRRPYKEPWTIAAALEEMHAGRGTQFDPQVIDAFGSLDHAELLAPIARPLAFATAG